MTEVRRSGSCVVVKEALPAIISRIRLLVYAPKASATSLQKLTSILSGLNKKKNLAAAYMFYDPCEREIVEGLIAENKLSKSCCFISTEASLKEALHQCEYVLLAPVYSKNDMFVLCRKEDTGFKNGRLVCTGDGEVIANGRTSLSKALCPLVGRKSDGVKTKEEPALPKKPDDNEIYDINEVLICDDAE